MGVAVSRKIYMQYLNFSKKENYNPEILDAVNTVNDNQKKYFFNKIINRFSKNNKFD